MLHFLLVVFLAQSVFALPTVPVNFYNINEVLSPPDNGRLINSAVTDEVFKYIDNGDIPVYANFLEDVINDIANAPDAQSQAAAALQTIVAVGELAPSVPGDVCEAAAVINASAAGGGTLRSAVAGFIQRVGGYIDVIAQLVANPNALRFASGPRGNCLAGGRSTSIEGAWEVILENATPYQYPLLNEEYCSAKRLSQATNSRSNNLAVAVTAARVQAVVSVAQRALGPLAQFLRVAASGGDAAQAAANAKAALRQAL